MHLAAAVPYKDPHAARRFHHLSLSLLLYFIFLSPVSVSRPCPQRSLKVLRCLPWHQRRRTPTLLQTRRRALKSIPQSSSTRRQRRVSSPRNPSANRQRSMRRRQMSLLNPLRRSRKRSNQHRLRPCSGMPPLIGIKSSLFAHHVPRFSTPFELTMNAVGLVCAAAGGAAQVRQPTQQAFGI